nr:hypothetical protein [Bartonella gliris]
MPVPTLPTIKRWIPSVPKKKQTNASSTCDRSDRSCCAKRGTTDLMVSPSHTKSTESPTFGGFFPNQ